jgi:hypothetical protein
VEMVAPQLLAAHVDVGSRGRKDPLPEPVSRDVAADERISVSGEVIEFGRGVVEL